MKYTVSHYPGDEVLGTADCWIVSEVQKHPSDFQPAFWKVYPRTAKSGPRWAVYRGHARKMLDHRHNERWAEVTGEVEQWVARRDAARQGSLSSQFMSDDKVLARLAEFRELERQRPGYVHAELMVLVLSAEARVRGLKVGA